MKNTVNFVKISAAGNDFILIDNRNNILPKNISELAKKLCHRNFSIGADGLIMLEQSKVADFKMKYFNSDGSEAAMCGNGGRSIARFAYLIKAANKEMKFETDAGIMHAKILEDNVRLHISEPKNAQLNFTLRVDKKEFNISSINTGVPHAVIFLNDIEKADVFNLGQMVRYHKHFSPEGTNVNFVQKKDDNSIFVRTYERGVEGETLACGTGVIASAIISGLRKLVKPPVNCITKSEVVLKVSYNINDEGDFISPVSNVFLEGPADVSFSGEVVI